jgi:uncharacterized protein involved in exopolysaccharide biosynthesis
MEQRMDLEMFFRMLLRHSRVVAGLTLLGLALAWSAVAIQDPVWQAETSVVVSPLATTPSGSLYGIEVLDLNIVGTYVQLLRSRQVARDSIERLAATHDRERLEQAVIDVRPIENSSVIVVSVRSTSRELSHELANSVVTVAMELNPVPALENAYPMVVLDPAEAGQEPAAPDLRLALLLGGLAGSMLGVGAATILDRRVAAGPKPRTARSAA